MHDVRIDRLLLHAPAHILHGMKKELYEIEQDARRMRAEEMSRLLHAGAARLISLFKDIRHA
jgi:hypothetical protein